MSTGIVKLNDDWYIEWSTITDAPASWGMNREEVEHLIYEEEVQKFKYHDDPILKRAAMVMVDQRLERLDTQGTTFHHYSNDSILKFNRAGKNETVFTKEQVIRWYCEKKQGPEEEGMPWDQLEDS